MNLHYDIIKSIHFTYQINSIKYLMQNLLHMSGNFSHIADIITNIWNA